MPSAQRITGLVQLLDRLDGLADCEERISLGDMIMVAGRRSFGPLLLIAGLIAVSPLSGIPGVPTMVAVLVVLIAGQLLCGRRQFWLPRWLLRWTVGRRRLKRALRTLRPLGRAADRITRPRLVILTHSAGVYAIAAISVVIAATMPPMEIVPFAATSAGAALTAFGLALIAEDGVVALIALLLTVLAGALIVASVVE